MSATYPEIVPPSATSEKGGTVSERHAWKGLDSLQCHIVPPFLPIKEYRKEMQHRGSPLRGRWRARICPVGFGADFYQRGTKLPQSQASHGFQRGTHQNKVALCGTKRGTEKPSLMHLLDTGASGWDLPAGSRT